MECSSLTPHSPAPPGGETPWGALFHSGLLALAGTRLFAFLTVLSLPLTQLVSSMMSKGLSVLLTAAECLFQEWCEEIVNKLCFSCTTDGQLCGNIYQSEKNPYKILVLCQRELLQDVLLIFGGGEAKALWCPKWCLFCVCVCVCVCVWFKYRDTCLKGTRRNR